VEQCRQAIKAQMPTHVKLAKSDLAIDNDSSVAALHAKVEQTIQELRCEAQRHPLSFLLSKTPSRC
jgi:dephospho-CoA kinase